MCWSFGLTNERKGWIRINNFVLLGMHVIFTSVNFRWCRDQDVHYMTYIWKISMLHDFGKLVLASFISNHLYFLLSLSRLSPHHDETPSHSTPLSDHGNGMGIQILPRALKTTVPQCVHLYKNITTVPPHIFHPHTRNMLISCWRNLHGNLHPT